MYPTSPLPGALTPNSGLGLGPDVSAASTASGTYAVAASAPGQPSYAIQGGLSPFQYSVSASYPVATAAAAPPPPPAMQLLAPPSTMAAGTTTPSLGSHAGALISSPGGPGGAPGGLYYGSGNSLELSPQPPYVYSLTVPTLFTPASGAGKSPYSVGPAGPVAGSHGPPGPGIAAPVGLLTPQSVYQVRSLRASPLPPEGQSPGAALLPGPPTSELPAADSATPGALAATCAPGYHAGGTLAAHSLPTPSLMLTPANYSSRSPETRAIVVPSPEPPPAGQGLYAWAPQPPDGPRVPGQPAQAVAYASQAPPPHLLQRRLSPAPPPQAPPPFAVHPAAHYLQQPPRRASAVAAQIPGAHPALGIDSAAASVLGLLPVVQTDGVPVAAVAAAAAAVGGGIKTEPSSVRHATPSGAAARSQRRVEQNRRAQRAFRDRKRRYVESLQQRADELERVAVALSTAQDENQLLRQIVGELRSSSSDEPLETFLERRLAELRSETEGSAAPAASEGESESVSALVSAAAAISGD